MKTKEGNNDVWNIKDDIERDGDFFGSFSSVCRFLLYACKSGEKNCEDNCGGLCGCTCTFCVLYDREIFLTAQSNEVSVQASKLFQEGETCKWLKVMKKS